MPTVSTICGFLDRFAPPALAAQWDNVGLLFGDGAAEARRVMTCLTVTPAVVAEAIAEKVDLIVTHHPILFRGVKRLSTANADGRLLWPLARAGIAVYSPHTAFDNTIGGINDSLARRLGLVDVVPLRRHNEASRCKVVVFVPESDLTKVSDAMFAAGAGVIGQYEQCSFRIPGTGTFFGTANTNPTVGTKGRREEVSELRLEVVCPTAKLPAVVAALRSAHSYEEPAFDVYPMQPTPGPSGEGRIGTLPAAQSLHELGTTIKRELSAGAVQIVGDAHRMVQRIAIACGAAGEFLDDAVKARADVFLTGEMRFHDYLNAESQGIALVLPGHYATERPAVEELAIKLQTEFADATVWASRTEADPVEWL
ncbi:MAG TPA: Nif3-like dinuclear metal center hexameric protein [Gemmataceae bacterium]|jgi:dinuclear metal center YbgI/SA1388 family protein|nr:Nif3-like dinuclear metal center hexameric protein [Gemmataceae bacterium]